jgi:hypothetical protein
LLLDLKARGLTIAPSLATGDGGMGFWAALREVFPTTSQQRCWVHKTANVLNKLPKSVSAKAKTDLQNIWMAATRKDAEQAFDHFTDKYGAKYEKAASCLMKDREALLCFYDFPAEHWRHTASRTRLKAPSRPSVIVPGRRRIVCPAPRRASWSSNWSGPRRKNWLRLRGRNQLPKLITGVKFVYGGWGRQDE